MSLIKENTKSEPYQTQTWSGLHVQSFTGNWFVIFVVLFFRKSIVQYQFTLWCWQIHNYTTNEGARCTLPSQGPTSFHKAELLPIRTKWCNKPLESEHGCADQMRWDSKNHLPESESFWSPFAPVVKGSFLLGAFSFISLTPSLRSSLGVLFDNTLSWKRNKKPP